MSSTSSIYEDVYQIRDKIDLVSRQLAKFKYAFEKMFEMENPEDLSKPIDELEFSIRTTKILQNAGITNAKELINCPDAQLLKLRNFGVKCYNEVQKFKEKNGKIE